MQILARPDAGSEVDTELIQSDWRPTQKQLISNPTTVASTRLSFDEMLPRSEFVRCYSPSYQSCHRIQNDELCLLLDHSFLQLLQPVEFQGKVMHFPESLCTQTVPKLRKPMATPLAHEKTETVSRFRAYTGPFERATGRVMATSSPSQQIDC
jgi:hypothetical protein